MLSNIDQDTRASSSLMNYNTQKTEVQTGCRRPRGAESSPRKAGALGTLETGVCGKPNPQRWARRAHGGRPQARGSKFPPTLIPRAPRRKTQSLQNSSKS